MVVDLVEERDDGVDGPVALEDVGVEHVDAELAVARHVVGVVGRRLVVLVLHEEEVPKQHNEMHLIHYVSLTLDLQNGLFSMICYLSDCPTFNEVVPVQRVEGVAEEERDEAVGPRVGPEDVQDPEAGAAETDDGQELELETGGGGG